MRQVIAVFQKGSKMGYVLPQDYTTFLESFLKQPIGSAITLVRAELNEETINEQQELGKDGGQGGTGDGENSS